RLGGVEQGRVDVDAETATLGEPDGLNGAVVDPRLADRAIVVFLVAIEMDRPGEKRVGLELVDLFFEQQRVGAEIDEFLAGDDALDDLFDLAMEQRLAAGDDDDRRTALIDRLEALGNTQP